MKLEEKTKKKDEQGRNGLDIVESMRANDPYETATHMMPRLLADKAV